MGSVKASKSRKICGISIEVELKQMLLLLCPLLKHTPRFPLQMDTDTAEEVTASNHWILPSSEFVGLWENLIFDDDVKENILRYMQTSLIFAESKINTNLISCNRIILLHGPPGTGKTSLCRAVAQKVSIRFQDRYKHIHLVEINSHSLFSKWFSESGKLVQKVFTQLRELIETPNTMVCILIDEIESVAFSRTAISNNEPSDSIRAVNAVLTQLDQIRKFTNVIVLATSNLTSNIDEAFLSRADIIQFIPPPCEAALQQIYVTILRELVSTGIARISHRNQRHVLLQKLLEGELDAQEVGFLPEFLHLCQLSRGISGRTVRKLPFLAHANFIDEHEKRSKHGVDLLEFIKAMSAAMAKHISDSDCVNKPLK
uniref:AAA+ ATPase domain-containing protein n=1 Tax=Phlebotomus papatasi TaxID=29031 RepID=A0A1B0D966_PHLPP